MQFQVMLFLRIKVIATALNQEVKPLPSDLLLLEMLAQVNQFRKQSW